MFCPKCDMSRPEDPKFCSECGTALIPLSTIKKGRIWPPLVFMAVMLAVGFGVFFLTWKDAPSVPESTPWFSVEDGTLYFDESIYTGGDVLHIPETVDGQTVTAISERCFIHCDFISAVEFPDTITTIGDSAFENCNALQGVKLPEGVRNLGGYAFYNCDALEAIYIPGSVDFMGPNTIGHCESLQHVFFAGEKDEWELLYPHYLNPQVQIYAVTGPDASDYSPI